LVLPVLLEVIATIEATETIAIIVTIATIAAMYHSVNQQ